MHKAEDIIQLLNLIPLEFEGGYFRQTYISGTVIQNRPVATAIYYLITDEPKGFSRLHQLPIDEIWHFYLGDPVRLLILTESGEGTQAVLGHNIFKGNFLQYTVPAGTWQGARLSKGGSWALLGTTTAPGFLNEDFKLPDPIALNERYPRWKKEIAELLWTEK